MKRLQRLAVLATLTLCALASTAPAALAAPPTIVSTTFVSTTAGATLKGLIDPGEKATNYHFEYGSDDCSANPCTALPIPDGKIPAGPSPVAISAEITGLSPATTYHYRLAAKNSESGGYLHSPDRTFATFAPSDTGLPDGRSYEQVSPVDKNGGDAAGQAGRAGFASLGGDAATFQILGGAPGGLGAQDFPIYLSRRGPEGWSTAGILPSPMYSAKVRPVGWTPDLAYTFLSPTLIGSDGDGHLDQGLLSRQSSDASISELAPFTDGGAFRLAGSSTDDSKLFFEAVTAGPGLTLGAAPDKPNLYLFNRDTGTASLVGYLPDDECDPAPCAPSGGSFAGAYDWWSSEAPTQRGGAFANAFTQDTHAISQSGDRAYFTAPGGQLYLRQGLAGSSPTTLHVSATEKTNGVGQAGSDGAGTRPAAFLDASSDGSKAFFTSPEKLTDDATTGPEPSPPPPPAIGQTNLEGKEVDAGLVPGTNADGLAVDSAHLYWADSKSGSIGRSNLEGQEVDTQFITGVNAVALAVDGEHIYWADPKTNSIGRADLEGHEMERSFITGAADPRGVAVDDEHVYWTNHDHYSLGRAKTDGSAVEREFQLLCTCDTPIAIAAGFDHLFFSFVESGKAGVTALKRDESRPSGWTSSGEFHFETPGLIVNGLAVDKDYVYWSVPRKGWIGRHAYAPFMENPDELEFESFTEGLSAPTGLAVNASHIYYSSIPVVPQNPGNDLYRFEPEKPAGQRLTDITVDTNPEEPNGAEVQGILGTSADGSYVYFAANGDLDGSGPAEAGDCTKVDASFGAEGSCNLYLSHEGQISFVSRLEVSGPPNRSDAVDWAPRDRSADGNDLMPTARVSASGTSLVFRSKRRLADYDNQGIPEFYRFHLGDPLVCLTCSPSGAPPVGRPTLQSIVPGGVSGASVAPIYNRVFSADGERFFFETPDKLVPADTNGDQSCLTVGPQAGSYPACQDVYEWEAAGSGGCASDRQPGGCIYLISTGKSPDPSFLGDASTSGENVFFFSRSKLVGQDTDDLLDLYDARVGGGLASQYPPSLPLACESPSACREAIPSAPEPPPLGSTGNYTADPKPKRCEPGKIRHGKHCVKPRRKRRHPPKHHGHGRDRAQANRTESG